MKNLFIYPLPTISIILSLIFCKIILRIKHSVNLNYDIEM